MYLSFYRLHDAPFNITPDPAFLYWTSRHQEAHAALFYGVDAQKGFIALIGEVGCGKTTILRSYLEQADPEQVKAVLLINPEQDFEGVLRTMLGEFGIPVPEGGTGAAVEALHQFLLDSYKANRRVVLIVDEAQRMPAETMERLRVLSNLETAKAKLLQIVLCGQPELEALLAQDSLRQIRERIAVRAYIGPLTPEDALAYIRHRVECVGGQAEQIFSRGALKEIIQRTKGNPRLLNVLCDNALVAGFANRERAISAHTVQEAAEVIGQRQERTPQKRLVLAAASLCVVAGLLIAGALADTASSSPREATLAKTETRLEISEMPSVKASNEQSVAVCVDANPDAETTAIADDAADIVSQTPTETSEHASIASDEIIEAPSDTVAESLYQDDVSAVGSVSLDVPEEAPAASLAVEAVPTRTESAPERAALPAGEVPADTAIAEPQAPTTYQHVWVTVDYGDTIESLVERMNGRPEPRLIKLTLALNPDMTDINVIRPGQRLAIPVDSHNPSEAAGRDSSAERVEE